MQALGDRCIGLIGNNSMTQECWDALFDKGTAFAHELTHSCSDSEGQPSNAADVEEQCDGHGTASVMMVQAETAVGLPQIRVCIG